MRKKSFQNKNLIYRYYRKFCNLQKRISLLMRSGEFFDLSREIQHRLIRRLKLLYGRMERLAGKQRLRWAGAALALILSASLASAQFNDTISLTGFRTYDLTIPDLADLDGDGDLDAVLGQQSGYVDYIHNNEGELSYATTDPFSSIDVGEQSSPVLADIDEDGDLDLLVGEYDGGLYFFENDAGVFTELIGVDNPFNGIVTGWNSHPTVADVDGDDDPDVVIGNYPGAIEYLENDAGVFTEMTGLDNPFDDILVFYYAAPYLADLDEDGDLDLIVGDYNGVLAYYENDGGVYTEQTDTDNPFDGIDVGTYSSPVLADADGDGDLDLAVGNKENYLLNYFSNAGGEFSEQRGQPNPFEGILGTYYMSPAFSDVDEDGDLDLLTGDRYGVHHYYENTNQGFVQRFAADDPFAALPATDLLKPVFCDIDGDGDEDLVVGDIDGVLHYFSKESAGDFFQMTGDDNPFDGIDVGGYSAPAFVDFDEDGDIDLFVGGKIGSYPDIVGSISYFRNVSGNYVQVTGPDNPFETIFPTNTECGLNPVFLDVDRDGDEDLFIGLKSYGIIEYAWNDEGVYAITDSRNPFLDVVLGLGAAPTFIDVDEDGDKDLYAGTLSDDGGILYMAESTQGPDIDNIPSENTDPGIEIYSYGKTIYLDAGGQTIDRVEVYLLSGQLYESRIVGDPGIYELNLPDALDGLYIVRSFSNGELFTEKVFLE